MRRFLCGIGWHKWTDWWDLATEKEVISAQQRRCHWCRIVKTRSVL